MAITGDRYVGQYEGHTLELVRDNFTKMLTLYIDGQSVASESVMFPHDITLHAAFDHNGAQHQVTAKSLVDRIVFTKDSIAIDGAELPITKTK